MAMGMVSADEKMKNVWLYRGGQHTVWYNGGNLPARSTRCSYALSHVGLFADESMAAFRADRHCARDASFLYAHRRTGGASYEQRACKLTRNAIKPHSCFGATYL